MKQDEGLLQWFLRLNGFLTIPNFVLHPMYRREGQRTEVDVIGIRFPHRTEFPDILQHEETALVLAEAKASNAIINAAWLRADDRVLEDLLACIGIIPTVELDATARQLRNTGAARTTTARVSFLLVATNFPEDTSLRDARRMTWSEVLRFIYERFTIYHHRKTAHDQWYDIGKQLWQLTIEHRNEKAFIAAARTAFSLR